MKQASTSGLSAIVISELFSETAQTHATASPFVIDLEHPPMMQHRFLTDAIHTSHGEHAYRASLLLAMPKKSPRLLFMATAACMLLIVLNLINIFYRGIELKENVATAAELGYKKLVAGGYELTLGNFEEARTSLRAAQENFLQAELKLWFLTEEDNLTAIRAKTFSGAQGIVQGGKYLASAAARFLRSAENLKTLPQKLFEANATRPSLEMLPKLAATEPLTATLEKEQENITHALSDLARAKRELNRVPQFLVPAYLRADFEAALRTLSALDRNLEHFNNIIPAALSMLGAETPHRYLILFQNSSEIRPSGGFIGSYMILDVVGGRISNTEVHDSYQTDWNIKEKIIPPPHFLPHLDNWRFRDSNYSADFPLSAETALLFLNKAGGPAIDTVFAVDQTLLRDLFAITGPVALPNLNKPLTAENFETVLSFIIESKFTGAEDPKRILKEFVPVFQHKLLQSGQFKEIAAVLRKAAIEKRLLGYSRETAPQQLFESLRMDGAIDIPSPKEKTDYLGIVRSSIGGNKSDAFIEEQIAHDTFFLAGGVVENELTIARTHAWTVEDENAWIALIREFGFKDIPPEIRTVLGTGTNTVTMRIYVPKGSVLLAVNGEPAGPGLQKVETAYDPELDAAYFYTQMETPHMETSTLKLRYRLPFRLDFDPVSEYRFFMQKQPGFPGSFVTKNITPRPRAKLHRFLPEEEMKPTDTGVLHFADFVSRDRTFVSLWGE